jgi:hypothetical protein
MRLPQTGCGLPQSCGQVLVDSPMFGWQTRSPQNGLHSLGQLAADSPNWGSQTPLPQELMQSCGQLPRFSLTSHIPLPHLPQSTEQFCGFSPGSHRPLPHCTTGGQSDGQVTCSLASQTPLPHRQSNGHEPVDSPLSHTPLPHEGT